MADKNGTSQAAEQLSAEEARLAIKAIEEVERQEANVARQQANEQQGDTRTGKVA